jgi:MFS family permease
MGNTAQTEPIDRRGWVLVWTLAAAQLISWGSLYYSFSLFVGPMGRDLGWSKSELNGALSLGLLIAGGVALPIGAWMDRNGGRAIMTLGSIGGGLLLLAWSQVTDIRIFFLIWALLGIVHSTTLYTPAFAVLTANLGGSYRRGITHLTVVGGLASTAFIPLTHFLIELLGWRHALVALALGNLPLCAAMHWLVLKGTVAQAASQKPADKAPLRRAMATGSFWGLMLVFTGWGAAFSALTVHLVPLLSERGLGMAATVSGLALIGPMQVAGRIGLLALGPRVDARQFGVLALACQPVAVLLLIFLPVAFGSLVLFAIVYGAGNGMGLIARGVIVPDLLGKAGYATINAALGTPASIAYALAPGAAAVLWQVSGNYDAVLWTLFGIGLFSTVVFAIVVRAGRPAPVAEAAGSA